MVVARKAKARVLDFSDVKEFVGHNPKRIPSGEYLATITAISDDDSKGGDPMWTFTLKLEGVSALYTYPFYALLTPNNLWKLRNFIICTGAKVPTQAIKLDPNKLVGRSLGVVMGDDEYDGKEKSTVEGTLPRTEVVGKEKPVRKAEVEDDDEDYEEEEEAPAPVKKKVIRRKPAPVVEEEEYEEEEEPVKPVRKVVKKPVRKVAVEEEEVTDDDMDELDLDDL